MKSTLVLALSAGALLSLACGDDSGAGGAGGSGGAEVSWETYCAETYCPQRAQQAEETLCDDDVLCEAGCEILGEACQPEVMAIADCAQTAELQCYDAAEGGTRVDLAPGACAAELNAYNLCEVGPCDAFDDAPCSPLACPDDTVVRLCEAGVCSADAADACDAARPCIAENFADVCPTLACDGASEQGCTPEGFCQRLCGSG